MFILGLQGSPRIKGNTGILLKTFLQQALRLGAMTERVDVARKKISPCLECGTCEKEGFCPIDDDMQEIYPLLWRADLIVMATPIFFYGPTAQMKALIDRSQALWARKYVHKLSDPGRPWRRGFLLSVGATKGKNLFEGTILTAKYFFDAAGARPSGNLTFSRVENAGEIKEHPTALDEVEKEARRQVEGLRGRKKILFLGRKGACRSQVAGAFARFHGGDRLEVEMAGITAAEKIDPAMSDAMKEKGLDMAYRNPQSLSSLIDIWHPDLVITLGLNDAVNEVSNIPRQDWAVPDPTGKAVDIMESVRDKIEEMVKRLI